jgi:hypothetical protein
MNTKAQLFARGRHSRLTLGDFSVAAKPNWESPTPWQAGQPANTLISAEPPVLTFGTQD